MVSMDEKRASRRFCIYQSTFFKTNEPNSIHDCLIHDLSMSGVMIETNQSLQQNDVITLAIRYGSQVYSEEVQIVRQMRLITLRYGGKFLSESNLEQRMKTINELCS